MLNKSESKKKSVKIAFEKLPSKVQLFVFEFLSIKNLLDMMPLSKRYYKSATHNWLWKPKYENHFGLRQLNKNLNKNYYNLYKMQYEKMKTQIGSPSALIKKIDESNFNKILSKCIYPSTFYILKQVKNVIKWEEDITYAVFSTIVKMNLQPDYRDKILKYIVKNIVEDVKITPSPKTKFFSILKELRTLKCDELAKELLEKYLVTPLENNHSLESLIFNIDTMQSFMFAMEEAHELEYDDFVKKSIDKYVMKDSRFIENEMDVINTAMVLNGFGLEYHDSAKKLINKHLVEDSKFIEGYDNVIYIIACLNKLKYHDSAKKLINKHLVEDSKFITYCDDVIKTIKDLNELKYHDSVRKLINKHLVEDSKFITYYGDVISTTKVLNKFGYNDLAKKLNNKWKKKSKQTDEVTSFFKSKKIPTKSSLQREAFRSAKLTRQLN
jgi:hypothetical protein